MVYEPLTTLVSKQKRSDERTHQVATYTTRLHDKSKTESETRFETLSGIVP
jgi:hypothetical protein